MLLTYRSQGKNKAKSKAFTTETTFKRRYALKPRSGRKESRSGGHRGIFFIVIATPIIAWINTEKYAGFPDLLSATKEVALN